MPCLIRVFLIAPVNWNGALVDVTTALVDPQLVCRAGIDIATVIDRDTFDSFRSARLRLHPFQLFDDLGEKEN